MYQVLPSGEGGEHGVGMRVVVGLFQDGAVSVHARREGGREGGREGR